MIEFLGDVMEYPKISWSDPCTDFPPYILEIQSNSYQNLNRTFQNLEKMFLKLFCGKKEMGRQADAF